MAMTLSAPNINALRLTNWPAAPNGNGVPALNVAVKCAEISRRRNVGKTNDFVIGNAVRNFQRSNIGKGDASVLRLASGVAAHHVGVTKKAGWRGSHHFL